MKDGNVADWGFDMINENEKQNYCNLQSAISATFAEFDICQMVGLIFEPMPMPMVIDFGRKEDLAPRALAGNANAAARLHRIHELLSLCPPNFIETMGQNDELAVLLGALVKDIEDWGEQRFLMRIVNPQEHELVLILKLEQPKFGDRPEHPFGSLTRLLVSLMADYQRTTFARPLRSVSKRQRECLYWVAKGKSSEEVANILQLSKFTVNNYILNAVKKLGAENRIQAIAKLVRLGLI